MKNSTLVSYVIVAASTAVLGLVVNYNLLVWHEKPIPNEMVPLISGLATGVFTAVTFKQSDKVGHSPDRHEDARLRGQ